MSDIKASNLFVELSDEQEELISGGGPTAVFDVGLAKFSLNNVTALESLTATPEGANTEGGVESTEIETTAAKFLVGQAGFDKAPRVGGLGGFGKIIGY
jgi:hypothetical protein